jgi:site-specific recombinase XerD
MTGVGQGHVSDWLVAYPAGTRHGYATDIGQFVDYLDGLGVDLLGVSRPVVQRWLAQLTARGLAPATVRRKASAVRSFYSYLVDEQVLELNPTAHLRSPKGAGPQKFGLTAGQARVLIAAASGRSAAAHALVWLMCGAGLRVSEACTACLEDIVGDVLTVTVKGGYRQSKPLSAPVREAVARAAGDRVEGPILQVGGRPVSRREGSRMIEELTAQVGIEHCTPHTLRHTAATLALGAGAPVQDVQQLLGHRSIQTTLRYIAGRDVLGAARSAADQLADTLTGGKP